MTIEQAIATHLAMQAPITALVSTRIYQGEREQGSVLPAITFDEVTGGSAQAIDGSVGLAFRTFQFNCYGSTSTVQSATRQASAIRELVRLAFQNFSGLMASALRVYGCMIGAYSAGFDPDTSVPVRSIDIEFVFQEAIP